jgi:hypothetical protein
MAAISFATIAAASSPICADIKMGTPLKKMFYHTPIHCDCF